MKKLTLLATMMCGAFTMSHANAGDNHQHTNPLDHAPIGVMGDHTHGKGEWMTSYRYGYMSMDGLIDDNDSVSNSYVSSRGFMIAPTSMDMQMHMFGVMYGLTDKMTLMAMGSYKENEMDHVFVKGSNAGRTFTTESKGLGDTTIGALFEIKDFGVSKLLLNAGVSLPTGSTDEKDINSVTGATVTLPYPMQLGSGTFDLQPGITYTGTNDNWGWGSQLKAVVRLGENSEEYSLGDDFYASIWGARKVHELVSVSVRLDGRVLGNIDGANPAHTNLNMVPTVRTDYRGLTKLDGLVGINVTLPDNSVLAGHRLAIEGGLPLYQNAEGIQMETDHRIMVGWQKAF